MNRTRILIAALAATAGALTISSGPIDATSCAPGYDLVWKKHKGWVCVPKPTTTTEAPTTTTEAPTTTTEASTSTTEPEATVPSTVPEPTVTTVAPEPTSTTEAPTTTAAPTTSTTNPPDRPFTPPEEACIIDGYPVWDFEPGAGDPDDRSGTTSLFFTPCHVPSDPPARLPATGLKEDLAWGAVVVTLTGALLFIGAVRRPERG